MWTGSSRGSTSVRGPRHGLPALPHSRRPAVCPLTPRLFEIPPQPCRILGIVSSPTNLFSTTKILSQAPPPTPTAYGLTALVGGTLARGYILFLAGLANSIRGLHENPGRSFERGLHVEKSLSSCHLNKQRL